MTILAATDLSLRTLLHVVIVAPLAGIGVTVAFSSAIYCADRASQLRRAQRSGAALAMTAVGLVALAACAGVVVYGLILVASKT